MEIREARAALNLRICDMARAMGVARSTYNKWERKEQAAPAAAIRLIKILIWLYKKNMLIECLENITKDDPAEIRLPKI